VKTADVGSHVSATCILCGRPVQDALVCAADALSLSQSLQIASGHAEDAEAVLTRQARYGAGGSGGSGDRLPGNLNAAERYGAIENTVGTWARHVVEERGMELPARLPKVGPVCAVIDCGHGSCLGIQLRRPPRGLAQAANWLSTQTEWLRRQPEAQEAFSELEDACNDLARLVDRPADKQLVGVCDCGKVLYAAEGRAKIQCPAPTCELKWDVEVSRDILRQHLGDKLVTISEAAHLMAYLDGDRTQDNLRKLIAARVKSGQVIAHGEDREGEPTYRFGEVAAILAAIPRRERKAA
jgi:hypothetical protein